MWIGRPHLVVPTKYEDPAPLAEHITYAIPKCARVRDDLVLQVEHGDFGDVRAGIAGSGGFGDVVTDRGRSAGGGRNKRRGNDDEVVFEHGDGGFGSWYDVSAPARGS